MEYKKCGSCGCFKSIEDIGCRKSGIVYKCCKRCRNKVNDKADEPVKEKNEPNPDMEINFETPNNLRKCFKCESMFSPIGRPYESIEYLTCIKCRTNGNHLHLDEIDISHEIYPEPPEPVNKITPRFIPDSSSESD